MRSPTASKYNWYANTLMAYYSHSFIMIFL